MLPAIFFVALLIWPAQKVGMHRLSEPAQPRSKYSLTFHATASHLRSAYETSVFSAVPQEVFYLEMAGQIEGRDLELESNVPGLLPPGDYPVRLSGKEKHKDGTVAEQYDLLKPDGSHIYLNVVGYGSPQ